MKHLLVLGLILGALAARHAEAISARQLVEVVDLGAPVVSPDGRSVAFRIERASIERNTYDSAWYVQLIDGGSPPLLVADGGVPLRDSAGVSLPTSATWSPDGRWIYYRAVVADRIDVWRAATDGSGAEPVTLDPADVRSFALSTDGQELKYSVGAAREEVIAAEQAEYDRGTRIHAATPLGQNLFRSGFTQGRLATERLAQWWNRVPLLHDVPDRWKAIDLVTRAERDIASSDVVPTSSPTPDLADVLAEEPWKVSHDPRSGRIALLTRVGDAAGLRDKPDVELAILPSESSHQPIKCLADLCTKKAITEIQWRPNSDEVLFTVTDPDEGHAQSIFRWNVATGAVHPVVRSRGLIGGGGRWDLGVCGSSSRILVCVAAEANRPPRLERIDLETGERRLLFDPNAALAWDMGRVPVRLLRWKDESGRQFTGQFYPAQRSDDVHPPLFVNYYRCIGFVRGGVGDEWPMATLAMNGISVLCINARPSIVDAVERYDTGRSAVESAIELLAPEGEIDRARVGMGGLSFGTEVTLWTAIHSDVLTAASVSSPGISPLYYLLGSLRGEVFFSSQRRNWQLGSVSETPERWRELSIVDNLDRIRAPILMQLPEQEYIHTLDYAIPLIRDDRADLYVFPHEAHQKFQPRHKLAVYERNLDWFRFWLQDFEADDILKADQYARWRVMRERSARSSAH